MGGSVEAAVLADSPPLSLFLPGWVERSACVYACIVLKPVVSDPAGYVLTWRRGGGGGVSPQVMCKVLRWVTSWRVR